MSKEIRSRRHLAENGTDNYYLANQPSEIQEVSSYQEDEDVTSPKNLVSPGFSKYVQQATEQDDPEANHNNESVSLGQDNSNEDSKYSESRGS